MWLFDEIKGTESDFLVMILLRGVMLNRVYKQTAKDIIGIYISWKYCLRQSHTIHLLSENHILQDCIMS